MEEALAEMYFAGMRRMEDIFERGISQSAGGGRRIEGRQGQLHLRAASVEIAQG